MRTTRRIVQVLFLLFFVYLFLAASYPLEPLVPVDLFLRTNPLVALSIMISSRSIITACLWSIVLILLTIPLGRVFCGWACPLGTLLDGFSSAFKNRKGRDLPRLRNLKYYLLVVILIASIFTLQLTWTLDPITLITRTLTLSLFPAATMASTSLFNQLFKLDFLQDTLLQLQMKLNSTLLPDEPALFHWSGLVLLIFLIIVGLELVSRRFWCRNLCPLGALYGLLSKYQVFKRRVSDQCNDCRLCASDCKMGAIENDFRKTRNAECILCYNCTVTCRPGATSLGFTRPQAQAFNLSRRSMLASSVASLSSVMLLKSSAVDANLGGRLIRPPGALPEPEFLDRCIRCHECIRVCSTSGSFLQPASLEAGLEGFLSPIGHARTGYCEYNCVMCTKVCPSSAIHLLDVKTKKKTVIGLARINRSRCIPWYRNEDCIVCEEHCPTPRKAIILKQETVELPGGKTAAVRRPYVVESLCIGCGICETKCPVKGESAIIITSENEQRWEG